MPLQHHRPADEEFLCEWELWFDEPTAGASGGGASQEEYEHGLKRSRHLFSLRSVLGTGKSEWSEKERTCEKKTGPREEKKTDRQTDRGK